MASVFFSYSHRDEKLRDRLEVALATLKRQGLIETWHDRMLRAGDEFDPGIRQELERSDIILLLVSPDFIASSYCYDVEMTRALERHHAGEARVIPVIREALPKAAVAPARAAPSLTLASYPLAGSGPRSSNLRISKTFSEAAQDRFLDEAFDFMAKFFEGSLSELKARNPEIDTAFKRIDANRFTAVIYQNGKAVSRCKIMLGGMLGRGMSYSSNDEADDNSCNDSLAVETNAQDMFLNLKMFRPTKSQRAVARRIKSVSPRHSNPGPCTWRPMSCVWGASNPPPVQVFI